MLAEEDPWPDSLWSRAASVFAGGLGRGKLWGMSAKSRIGDILLKAGLIDELQLRSALATQDQWGGRMGKIVAELGFVDEDPVSEAIAKALFLRRVSLGNLTKDPGALSKLDVAYCESHGIFPISLEDNGKTLMLAMADPTDLAVIDEVALRARARVITVVAGEREIQAAILRHYRHQEPDFAFRHPSEARLSSPGLSGGGGPAPSEELELTDMSGNSIFLDGSRRSDFQETTTPAGAPLRGSESTGALLDEILAPGGGSTLSFTAEEQARLEVVRANQEKSSRILRAMMELVLEKRAVDPTALQARLRSR